MVRKNKHRPTLCVRSSSIYFRYIFVADLKQIQEMGDSDTDADTDNHLVRKNYNLMINANKFIIIIIK